MAPDILVLTIYFICLFYVLYQMAKAVEDAIDPKVMVKLDRKLLKEQVEYQLERQNWDDVEVVVEPENSPLPGLQLTIPRAEGQRPGVLQMRVGPQGKQTLSPVPGLAVGIVNQVPHTQISIDWDNSTFTMLGNQSRRVIRNIPGMLMTLSQPQVHTVVNPDQTLAAVVTTEECFGRNPDTQVLQPVAPLINYGRLLDMKGPPIYSLGLLVSFYPTMGPQPQLLQLLVTFRFMVEDLPEQPAIPLFRWLLRFGS